MKSKRHIVSTEDILVTGMYVLTTVVVIGLVVTEIYCLITYGDKPISEIPGWALWFLFRGK